MIATTRAWNRVSRTFSPSIHIATQQSRVPIVRMSSTSTPSQPSAQQDQKKPIYFGPFNVTNQVFLTTPHSFALVNLKPLLPGHVLVCPLRPHHRLTDLSPVELTDLFTAVQRVQRMLARHYFSPPSESPNEGAVPASGSSAGDGNASHPSTTTSTSPSTTQHHQPTHPHPGDQALPEQGSFNIALQDGPEAGQTVPHAHVHIIPRIRGSTAKPPSTPSDAIYDQMASEEGNVGGALWDAQFAPAPSQQEQEREREREKLAGEMLRAGRPVPGGGFPRIEDADRMARGMGEMEEEAGVYRRVLEGMEREEREGREAGQGK